MNYFLLSILVIIIVYVANRIDHSISIFENLKDGDTITYRDSEYDATIVTTVRVINKNKFFYHPFKECFQDISIWDIIANRITYSKT